MRASLKKIPWPARLLRRADRVASDLNVILAVFAIGLATLDLTCLAAQKIVDQLPQVTRLADGSVVPTPTP